jgi:hypothetical protein
MHIVHVWVVSRKSLLITLILGKDVLIINEALLVYISSKFSKLADIIVKDTKMLKTV